MDLRLLRYFVACVEHKSLHAAAEALHISQPSLSKAIHTLESDLGVALFDRHARGVTATPYGQALLRYAKMIDSELRRARAEIDAMRGATKGRVHVGVMPTVLHPFFTRAVTDLIRTHPGLKVNVRTGFSADLTAALLDGELDVILALAPPGQGMPELTFEPLLPTGPAIVARGGHPLAGRAGVSLRELAEFPWLLPDYPATHRETLNRVFLDAGVPPPEATVEVSTVVLFQSLIESTDLLTIMPTVVLAHALESGALAIIDADVKIRGERLGLAYRSSATLLPGARALMKAIRAAFEDAALAAVMPLSDGPEE